MLCIDTTIRGGSLGKHDFNVNLWHRFISPCSHGLCRLGSCFVTTTICIAMWSYWWQFSAIVRFEPKNALALVKVLGLRLCNLLLCSVITFSFFGGSGLLLLELQCWTFKGNYVKMLRRCLIKCSFESKCFLLLIIDDDGDLLLLPILKLICFAAYFATSFQN